MRVLELSIKGSLFLSFALICSPAHSTNDMRGLSVMLASWMCAYQDPAFRDSPGVKVLQDRVPWDKFDATPLAACMREKQWLSPDFCRSMGALDLDDPIELDGWFHRNGKELQQLEPLFDFFSQEYSPTKCPETDLPPARDRVKDESEPAYLIESASLTWSGLYEGTPPPLGRETRLQETDKVPGELGRKFGIAFVLHPGSKEAGGIVRLRYRVTFPAPGLRDRYSEQVRLKNDDTTDCVPGRECMVGYAIEGPEEIIPGDWHMIIALQGKILIDKKMTVVQGGVTTAQR
jgi:hypothetical protein